MALRKKKPLPVHKPRLSVSFSPELYDKVEKIAKRDSRSLGWVIRKAVEDLVKAELPLFNQTHQ